MTMKQTHSDTDASDSQWDAALARAHDIFASSLEYHATLEAVSRLLVPRVADWASVELMERGRLVSVALAHEDPERVRWARALRERYPADPESPRGLGRVFRSGEPVLMEQVTDEMLRHGSKDEQHYELLKEVGLSSILLVPLKVEGATAGVISLVRGPDRPAFDAKDLERAQDFARAGSFAVERARLHARVAAARDQLQTVLGAIDEGIIVRDPRGNIVFANEAAARLTGAVSSQALVAQGTLDATVRRFEILDENGRPFPADQLPGRLALKGVSTRGVLCQWRPLDGGETRWSAMSGIPVFDENGQVQYSVSVFRDVTEERLAYEAKARLAAIIDSSSDAIVSKDLTGRVRSWNAGAEAIFGYTAQEMVGRSITTIIPPEHLSEEDHILSELRAGRRISHYETRRRRKDGTIIDISLSVSPVFDPSGKVIAAAKIARDITERKRTERKLAELNASLEERVRQRTLELEQAMREAESFNYTVSHDLRTPLRAITGFAKILSETAKLDEESRHYFGRILDAAQSMTSMTDNLLRLTRIRAEDVRRVKLDLSSLTRRVVDRLAAGDPARPTQIEIEPGLEVEADPALLEVLVENLVGNAWKFSSGKPLTRIQVGRTERGGRTTFFVRDNGVGFAAKDVRTLFQPFKRLQGTAFPGEGIGLATAHRIIRVHGGGIDAEGVPGEGATFYFWV